MTERLHFHHDHYYHLSLSKDHTILLIIVLLQYKMFLWLICFITGGLYLSILFTNFPYLYPSHLASTHLFSVSMFLSFCLCVVFKIPGITEIIRYLSSSVGLISLSTTLRSIRVVANGNISFFQIGLFGVLLAIELYEFFIHFGYKLLLRYIVFKCFLSSVGCPFHLVDGFLCSKVAFEFGVVPLVYFCFCCLCIWCQIKKSSPRKTSRCLLPMFSFRSFMVSGLTFKSLIRLNYFLCSVSFFCM